MIFLERLVARRVGAIDDVEIAFAPRYADLTHEQATTSMQRIQDEVLPMLGLRQAAE